MNFNRKYQLAFAILLLILNISVAQAVDRRYFESFATRQNMDAANTTALWDTVAGEIKLHPFTPGFAGSLVTPGNPTSIVVDGDYAYLSDGSEGLLVIDISDPTAPGVLGYMDTPGSAWGIAVAGNHVFVGDSASGLQVIDVTNPAAPTIVGSYNTTGTARGLTLSGNQVFIADGTHGLKILDITDPTNPTLLGSYDTPGESMTVAVAGNTAFVADRDGLVILDISDPSAPELLGSYATPGDNWGVAVDGDFVFLGDASQGMHIIDVTDPTSPVLLGSFDTTGSARGVTIDGDRAIVCDYGQTQIIDITNPGSPFLVSTIDNPGVATQAAVAGEHIFIAAGSVGGLQVYQDRIHAFPEILAFETSLTGATGVTTFGNYAYAFGYWGLSVFDVSDPFDPVFVTVNLNLTQIQDIDIQGDFAFVTRASAGFEVLDLSDPEVPTLVGEPGFGGSFQHLDVEGDFAYVTENYFQVIDVSVPASPALVGGYSGPFSGPVRVVGNLAYVGANTNPDLWVLDVSDPTNPTLVGNYDSTTYGTGAPLDMAIEGDVLYLCTFAGLFCLDISDPTNISQLGHFAVDPDYPHSIHVSGDIAFMAFGQKELVLADVSDPSNPVRLGDLVQGSNILDLAVSGNYAYVPSLQGITVYSVFSTDFLTNDNFVQSIWWQPDQYTVAARLTTTQSPGVTWYLDAGNGWEEFVPGNDYRRFDQPGYGLRWLTSHHVSSPGDNPVCSDLQIDVLMRAAYIDSVTDIPGDQGGRVRVHLARSGYDSAEELTYPVVNYYIWQRIDDYALLGKLEEKGSKNPSRWPEGLAKASSGFSLKGLEGSGLPLIEQQGRFFHLEDSERDDTELPPGVWEVVGDLPGAQMPTYIHRTTTLADSTAQGTVWSVYCVTAHTTTPSVWFASAPDSGYSVDNLAPSVPTGFTLAYGLVNDLSWDESPDTDFRYFNIYRGDTPDFIIDPGQPHHMTSDTSWQDPSGSWGVYYQITALDYAGNESDSVAPDLIEMPSWSSTVFSATARGGITQTGNTLGLSKETNANGPGTRGSIGTFLTTDDGMADLIPANPANPWFAGTTASWQQNGSAANLELPNGATILHAELVWGGSYGYVDDVSAFLDSNVELIHESSNNMTVTPNPATAVTLDEFSGSGVPVKYYVRSADVTNFVENNGPGYFEISGVPATQNESDNTRSAAGWALIVAYGLESAPQRFLEIRVGGDFVEYLGPCVTNFYGFLTPTSGAFEGRVLLSALEGDVGQTGDGVLIEYAPQAFTPLSSPNNPEGNFFASQVNRIDGLLDISGSAGSRNHDANSAIPSVGARQGWDLTGIPLSSDAGQLTAGQASTTVQVATSGDQVVVCSVALQLDLETGISGVNDAPIARSRLLWCYPNPFNPETTIEFELRERAAVDLRVFDLSGRVVRSLLQESTLDSGRHTAVWNGRDDSGRQVASGTYFYRLEVGDSSETKRMVLIK